VKAHVIEGTTHCQEEECDEVEAFVALAVLRDFIGSEA
jgi:hypothetical protein